MSNTIYSKIEFVADGPNILCQLENGSKMAYLGSISGFRPSWEEDAAFAKRIVACLNFCEGTSNEFLLARSLDSINSDLDRLLKLTERKNVDLMDSYSLIGQYRGQRDALFRAAGNFVKSYGSEHTKELREARALVKRHDHSPDPMMEALEQILKDSAELPHIHEIARKALEKGGAL